MSEEVVSYTVVPSNVIRHKVQVCPNCGATYIVPPPPNVLYDVIEVECRCGNINSHSLVALLPE